MGFGHLEKAVEKQKLTRHSGPLADRQRQCVCVTASRTDSDSEIEATRGRADDRCTSRRNQLRSSLLCWPALARHGPHAGLPGLGCADVGSGGAAEAERSGGRRPAGWGWRLGLAQSRRQSRRVRQYADGVTGRDK